MSNLTIAWEYLTGYVVASHPSQRSRAEWPPHPARVFMAMAAAWFETQPVNADEGERVNYDAEGAALRWLETLDDPELILPVTDAESERTDATVFVPVNDQAGPSAAILQSAPALTRDKQPRSFPRKWVGNEPCAMRWETAKGCEEHRVALRRLCEKVTRIGHSSSLVSMWVDDDPAIIDSTSERFAPDSMLSDLRTRTVSAGFFDVLVDRYGAGARQRRVELLDQIEQLKTQKKNTKGKGSKEVKVMIDEQIESLQTEVANVPARSPIRPSTGQWANYRKLRDAEASSSIVSGFDTDVLVLVADRKSLRLPAETTLSMTRALRNSIMKHSGIQPVPDWVSGHTSDGEPLQDRVGHISCIPLPACGHRHSDGHLLGAGVVFPRSVDRQQRGEVLRPLLINEKNESKTIYLKLGKLGAWSLMLRDWSESRVALTPETWTAQPNGSCLWASVTPLVLDRFPKTDRCKEMSKWTDEVSRFVATSCKNIGLPEPVEIDISTTSWQAGIPRSTQKRRPLRGQPNAAKRDAALGNGFPAYPAKNANASKPQVHVWLRFSEPVVGPVLLGAGRFLGYGLCMPWSEKQCRS